MDKSISLSESKHEDGANFKLNEELEKEIIQRKQAEEGLIRQQEFSRALLESMADGVVACNGEGVLTLFNRTAREWHGMDPMRLPPEEWAKHYDLFHSDGTTPLSAEEVPLARAFRGEIVEDAGMSIVAKGQAARFILANGSVIRDETGKKLGAVVVMHDITELRRVEEELRKANEELESAVTARTSELETTLARLKAELEERKRAEETLEKERKRMDVILSALNTGLSLINPDMTIAWVNQKIREMFPGREPVGQVCHVFYESRATICEGCGTLRAFMDGKVCESEQLVPATGRWYYIISQPIKDTAGRVVNILEGITDITERKLAEQILRESEARLQEAQRIAKMGNWDWDIVHNRLWWSDETYRIFGLSPQEFGATFESFINAVHPDDRERVDNSIQETLQKCITPWQIDYRIALADGSVRFVHEEAKTLCDHDANPVRRVGTVQDITEYKLAEDKIRKLNEELEHRVRERTSELEEKNRELGRMNKLFVGRELRMIELKERIKELEKQMQSRST